MGQFAWFLKAPLRPTFVVFMSFSIIYIICTIYSGMFSRMAQPKSSWDENVEDGQDDEEFSFFVRTPSPFEGDILVHIDLKGAPPKLSFLLDVIAYVKKLGATGILLEYEDMFPYHDGLEDISATNAYFPSQITQIVEQAEKNNLTIVPYLPTFGHFEFFLKQQRYRHFREVDEHPEVLCPSQMDVYEVLKKMIDQILAAHPKARYLHIGCDDPGFLGVCEDCRKVMRKNKWRTDDIFFNHVKKIAQHIASNHSNVKPIIWGHKVVKENEKIILTHRIPFLVDVMLYNSKSERKSFPKDSDMKTIARIFKTVWVAGAFKGTNGRMRIMTSPEFHVKNTKSWMRFITKWKGVVHFKGFALAGWQRYSHFSSLCELLPIGIPTLALSLQYINYPSEFDYVEIKTSDCDDYEVLPSDTGMLGRCGFPGFDIFQLFTSYSEKLDALQKLQDFIQSGALSFSYIFNNFTNSQFIKSLNEKKYHEHLYDLNFMEKEIRIAMSEIYDDITIDEWVMLHVTPQQMLLEATVNTIKAINNIKEWPRRPFRSNIGLAWKLFGDFCNPNKTVGCTFLIKYS